MNKVMSITGRLLFYIEQKGININQITVRCGLTHGALNKALRKEGGGLHSETIERILQNYPDLDADWLMTGIGHWKREPPRGARVFRMTHEETSQAAEPQLPYDTPLEQRLRGIEARLTDLEDKMKS